MTSSNPAFSGDVFQQFAWADERPANVMTVEGTALKSGILLAILGAAAAMSWSLVDSGQMSPMLPMVGSLIGGLVVGLWISFQPKVAPYASPLYAALQGVFLGVVSRFADRWAPGLPVQAVMLTFSTALLMLVIYATGLIKVTPRFVAGITAAIGAVCLVYIGQILLSLFGGIQFLTVNDPSPMSIIFSVVVVALAAFSLLLDFEMIAQGSASSAPKWMEWYGAFGLMVTLIWLYLEILKLLMKLNSRD